MSYTSLTTQARHLSSLCALSLTGLVQTASAQIYNGGGPLAGVNATSGLTGIPRSGEPREVIASVISTILSFMSLIAVATVIIAGIYLIVGLGSDDSKDKAKKIIQYTLIGLVIILFSQIIVSLVTVFLADQIS